MKTPEIKVGQKYRVINSREFGYTHVQDGDVFTVQYIDEAGHGYLTDAVFMFDAEISSGVVELVEDAQESTEASENVSELPCSEAPEDVETHAQASTGSSDDIIQAANTCVGLTRSSEDIPGGITMYRNGEPMNRSSGMSGELLWKFIEGSSAYNEHKQLEINEMSFGVLKETVRIVSDYVTKHVDTTADMLEIRLSYNGDTGKFAGTWGTSVYQLNYWRAGEHSLGHTDRLLFGVEIVRDI